ncbi:hypothetical protein MC7420_5997 [Coleofasciculus chthonoplastes PCC 7420]|uniref:Uncharacterized protein n=1 Tax=Coleofasciculus chthonoplastes PCC 7420 TaxID=118168 RepID=B4W5D0_9CYAN|nr:hypothetical protein MC7420_5997 [Coleofasciculus chthonoplastes PCC 7420]
MFSYQGGLSQVIGFLNNVIGQTRPYKLYLLAPVAPLHL